MAELEAGLLAGFGLSAPGAPRAIEASSADRPAVPRVQAEVMPTVQPPQSEPIRANPANPGKAAKSTRAEAADPTTSAANTGATTAPDQSAAAEKSRAEEMAELEAGLLAGFGLATPAQPAAAESASPNPASPNPASPNRTASSQVTKSQAAADQAAKGRTAADQAAKGRTAADQAAKGRTAADRVASDRVAKRPADSDQAAKSRATADQTASDQGPARHSSEVFDNQAETPHTPARSTSSPDSRQPAAAEAAAPATRPEGKASQANRADRNQATRKAGPTRSPADYVPGSKNSPGESQNAHGDEEPAYVVERPAAARVTIPVTTSAPISASSEAAQESFQELIGRPGNRNAPEPASPETTGEEDPDEAPIPEYTTTHADLDAARLNARLAASRRARSMIVLLAATSAAWVFSVIGSVPVFIPIAATLLLSAHAVASRTAAVRSRETLTMMAAHLYAAEMAREHAEKRRQAAARTRARAEALAAAPPPEWVKRRAAAVSGDTWDPIPVPPPTYQLKPAVHRPAPPPLEKPAEKTEAAPDRQVSRGSMPRRAAEIERILQLDQDAPRAVNE
ncbi:hypothetical protein [Kineosporia babensis]|uniref:Uncharacterized protein n=1 Tax=Kineosporia babensis TaxID=499548 RepID=A0A9X1SXW1_9ACTN|nr:hypothetical protein [Kineosporia babensis]MCD5315640.1 hypothetical protein [Kineosporia babensis]